MVGSEVMLKEPCKDLMLELSSYLKKHGQRLQQVMCWKGGHGLSILCKAPDLNSVLVAL